MKKTLHLINLQPNVTAHLEPNQPDHSSSTTRRRLSNIRKRSIGFSLPAISTVPGTRVDNTLPILVRYHIVCQVTGTIHTTLPLASSTKNLERTCLLYACSSIKPASPTVPIKKKKNSTLKQTSKQANKQTSKQASKQTSKQTSKQANKGFSPKWRGKKSSRGII